MSTPERSLVTASLQGALLGITRVATFRTNIGERVIVGGERKANPGELPCCILTPGAEVPADNADPAGSAVVDYSISAFVNRRDDAAQFDRVEWESIDAMLADVREAIELNLCSIDGARNIVYQGAAPIYSGGDTEPCGVVVRYAITTKQH